MGKIFSLPRWPSSLAHSGGGRASGGCAVKSSSMCEKCCSRRMRKNDISLYANYSDDMRRVSTITETAQPYSLFCRTHLLAKADSRSRVERKEYERVTGEVLVETLIQETFRIEVCRW